MLKQRLFWVLSILMLVPALAHAGDFPGLVETLLAVLAGVSLLLGMITEGLLAALRHYPFRWPFGLLYALYWFLGILILAWSRRA